MNRQEIQDYAELSPAANKHYNSSVSVSLDDGSFFMLSNAFLEVAEEWLVVYTEHHGVLVFEKDLANVYKQWSN